MGGFSSLGVSTHSEGDLNIQAFFQHSACKEMSFVCFRIIKGEEASHIDMEGLGLTVETLNRHCSFIISESFLKTFLCSKRAQRLLILNHQARVFL